jgi:hypothetical protein
MSRPNHFRPVRRVAGVLAVTLGLAISGPSAGVAAEPLRDAPVIWHEDDRRDIPQPEERSPNVLWDSIADTFVHPIGRFFNPGRVVRRVGVPFGGQPVQPAANVNALDEVPNSTWFTNRIGIHPLGPMETPDYGYEESSGPDTTNPWTIVSAKTEGVTPGFNIRDSRGDVYLIKFDPMGYEGTSTGAGAISARIFHLIGYNVPVDNVVYLRRDDLVLGDGVRLKLPDGSRREMTTADIDTILARVRPAADGRHRAIASRLLSGKPVGPFDFKGRRDDDPNDRVDHEDRRELRGLRMFAAWLAHFDTKQNNSLDMYVEQDGRHFVRHHLIDFASTLGAGANGAVQRYNFEYTVDAPAITGRTLALGFHEDDWRKVNRPAGLAEVGFFESVQFDPMEWKPLAPNSAFANLTDRDGYWAAKIISAFSDNHLEEIVARARYENPAAAEYVTRILAERRDKIARVWFDRVPPLDFFTFEGAGVRFRDLGAERGIYPGTTPRYEVRAARVSEDRGASRWSNWVPTDGTSIDLSATVPAAASPEESGRYPFVAVQVRVDRGDGPGPPVTVYVAPASQRVIGVDR